MAKKVDARVSATKKALHKTLIDLIKSKSVAEISVKELCEGAKISRGAFYLHYHSPLDVLHEIEDEFIAKNINFKKEDFIGKSNRENAFAKQFEQMLTDKDMAIVIFGPTGDPHFRERVKELTKPMMMSLYDMVVPGLSQDDLSRAFEYSFYGSIPLILEWQRGNYPASELAKKLDTYGKAVLLATKEIK